MIIGLTGTISAGKGTVSNFLKERGFKHFSVREFLTDELRKKNLPINRDEMVLIANILRKENSPSYIVEKLYELAKLAGGNCVIESIRTIGEVDALRKKEDFYLLAVDAKPELRYKRAVERASETDKKTFEEFLEDEKREMNSQNSNEQNLKGCIDLADFILNNDGSVEELEIRVNDILKKIGFEKSLKRENYLSWDEYFMGVALLSAQRSKDPNTQVGACIVNNEKKIMGVGYNGFPISCSDDSLPWSREGSFLETKYAYVCHAELNAILNSFGRDLRDCIIYVGLFPCNECAKAIIQSGIKEVVYLSDKYADSDPVKASKIMFEQSGVKYRKLKLGNKKIEIKFSV